MAEKKWQENDFLETCTYNSDTALWANKLPEIALSCTISEILSIFHLHYYKKVNDLETSI